MQIAFIIGIIAIFLLTYFTIYRPWQIHWGATTEEVKMPLPGDDIVVKPDFKATRAITIHRSQHEVWKWIIQIGSKRAGWYSIDWIDNGGTPSSDKILPQFQVIEAEQFIPFTPNQKNGMWVKDFVTDQYIVWWDKKGNASWLWHLAAADGKTRLLTRLCTKYQWKSIWILYYLLADAFDIVMMRKCLKGIKRRAEG